MFSCMAQFSLSSSPLWARRHGTVPLVTDNTKNRRTSRDPLHGPFCTIIRAQRTSSDVFQMASPIDLTASDDDGSPDRIRTKLSHANVQASTIQGHKQDSSEPLPTTGSADAARAAIMGQALQANKQGANPLLAQLAAARRVREAEMGTSRGRTAMEQAAPANRVAPAARKEPERAVAAISVLSYNIWFDSLAMQHRMAAIGKIIMEKGYPTIICLQEVTSESYEMMRRSPWFSRYMASPFGMQSYDTAILYNKSDVTGARPFQKQPFDNSRMGRSVLEVALNVGGTTLRCATAHLESPVPGALGSAPRRAQLSQALKALDAQSEGNLFLAGDMNWNDDKDGMAQLPSGWRDIWAELNPGDPGYTYDGRDNAMLTSRFRTRLDRIFAKLADWEPESIEMVGQDALPGLAYSKVYRGKEVQARVLPSDHYGLLLRLRRGNRATESGPL